jgi:hypothetical protein
MEDASGMDLDWFWRGWFYTTDRVDISLDTIMWYKVDLKNNPEKMEKSFPIKQTPPEEDITKRRNREEGIKFVVEEDETLQDFYYNYKPWETADSVITMTNTLYGDQYSKKEKKQKFGDKNYYELHFSNEGGLVMPIILEWTYEDGTTEIERIPVQIWRHNEKEVSKVFVKDKVAVSVVLDPYQETADIDRSNNEWPVREMPSRFKVYKSHKAGDNPNPMQRAAGKS